jgi:hypothetical protein
MKKIAGSGTGSGSGSTPKCHGSATLKSSKYLKVANLQCLQNMSEGGEKLGRLDHERGPSSAGKLEDDLCVGDGVELGERPDEDGGPALTLQHVRVPLRHHSPDQVRLTVGLKSIT